MTVKELIEALSVFPDDAEVESVGDETGNIYDLDISEVSCKPTVAFNYRSSDWIDVLETDKYDPDKIKHILTK
jgi:hypothetical protein